MIMAKIDFKKITIIIPVYNEAENIGKVLDDILSCNYGCEIIVVDDGSTDQTNAIANPKEVRVIKHRFNKGHGAALKTGIKNTQTEYVVFFDGDGQHVAADIKKLAETAGEYDAVVGRRDKGSSASLIRKPGKKLISLLANYLTGKKIPDVNSGLRITPTATILQYLHILSDEFSFSTTMTLAYHKENLDIGYVPIITKERQGQSKVRFFRDGFGAILLTLRMIALFDPLRIFIPISVILFVLGMIRFVQTIVYDIDTAITSILGILGGTVIFLFGLLADQIASLRRDLFKSRK